MSSLPPGWTLDSQVAAPSPSGGLPAGFTLDGPSPPNVWADVGKGAASGLATGTIGAAGAAGDAVNWVGGKVGAIAGMIPGLNLSPDQQQGVADSVRHAIPFFGQAPTTAELQNAITSGTGWKPYQPQTKYGEYANTIASFVPGAASMVATGGVSAIPRALTTALMAGVGSQAGGDLAGAVVGKGARPYGQLAGALLGGGIPAAGRLATASRTADAASAAAPSIADIKSTASQLYAAARNEGVAVKPDVMDGILQDVIDVGKAKGADPGTTSAAWSAIQRMETEKAGGPIAPGLLPPGKSLDAVDTLRQVLSDAQGQDGKAAASAMLAEFDKRINALGAGDVLGNDPKAALQYLNQARSTWQVLSKSKTIGKVISDADLVNTPDKPGAYETTLRAGFRSIAKDDNFTKYWTPDEQAAIIAAAKGGGVPAGLLRLVGKSAATIPIAGVPFNALTWAGNQPVRSNAALVDALVRTGPQGSNPFTATVPAIPKTTQDLAAALAGGSLPFRQPALPVPVGQ